MHFFAVARVTVLVSALEPVALRGSPAEFRPARLRVLIDRRSWICLS